MIRSSYINGLPEAEYQVIENGLGENIIDRFLQNNQGKIANAFANLIDEYAADKKGRLFTAAIIASGYSNNSTGLQEFYTANAKTLDDYFTFIDMQALAASIGGDLEEEIVNTGVQWFKTRIPAFLAGASVLALYVYLKRSRK